ncbi:DUF4440 domain-containing protein [Flagellimonas sp. S3867]|uniref:DUF4440 domain-containing protein n=1 Tax=Flagellimonas sp. S3867 TaxID=2768063 RepID=UPI0016864A3A|nr:DUF4440 domain-containing protein [Flagellimonas sp. S3867]
MNNKLSIISIMFFLLSIAIYGQEEWTSEQQQILETMQFFSETTAPNGKGADAYGSYLSDDFSRWTIGSSITNNKNKWVEGVREWFDDGWRVSERKQQNLEILIIDSYAHTRRIVTETYLGPKGDTSESKAALAEIWIKKDNKWLLYRVNVHPMPND